MKDVSFKCNALIQDRNPVDVNSTIRRNVERFGNWIGGAVILRRDDLVFSINAMNADYQQDASDLIVPYSAIASCRLGRMMMLFKTVDLETSRGELRFRCMGAANDELLAELKRRRQLALEGVRSLVDELNAIADIPVSDSVAQIAKILAGQKLRAGVARPVENVDHPDGPVIEFLVGQDKYGASWLYLYTSEQAMIRGGLAGSNCVTMRFEELFEIARRQGFGGIVLDFSRDEGALTAVPAEYFDTMAAALGV